MTDPADHPNVPVMPPVVFLGYLIGALVLNQIHPFPMPWPLEFRMLGGAMAVAGFWLSSAALRQMIQAHTSPDPHQAATTLIREGLYRHTRNPIYLGFLGIYLGFTFLAATLWGILLSPFLFWTITHTVIHAEEEYLEDKFGEQYTYYKSRVRRWI